MSERNILFRAGFTSLLTLFLLLWLAAGNVAAEKTVTMTSGKTSGARIALAIGNSDYKMAPLTNPTHDAEDMAAALKKLGFKVTLKTNATQKEMKQALREFGEQLKREGGTGMLYYAGHGIQSQGRNFLIPVNAEIQSEAEIEDQSVDLNLALNYMEEAKNGVNVVVLDACRNNPFSRSFRSASRGLAQVDAPSGTLIAYATAPGSVAEDGRGRNGLYTSHLLESMKNPDSYIEMVFKRVRKGVYQESSGRQIPWESSSLVGDFSFNSTVPATKPGDALPQTSAMNTPDFELEFWEEIKDRNTPSEYAAYLEQYPNGKFAALARARMQAVSNKPENKPVTLDVSSLPVVAANQMLGAWNGSYGYLNASQRVPFKLIVTTIDGSKFAGKIAEPATFGSGTSKYLFANVFGEIGSNRVNFIKVYDGTGGVSHSVNYQGILRNNISGINGNWAIGEVTGPFEMQHD